MLERSTDLDAGPDGPLPWLGRIAGHATLESTVLQTAVQGEADILALLRHAVPVDECRQIARHGYPGSRFMLESYRARVHGVWIACSTIVHMNACGEADSVLIEYQPPAAALLLSRWLREQAGAGTRDLYLTEASDTESPVVASPETDPP